MPKVGMQPIRRQQLIDATLMAIDEVGLHEASIAQIARRAGVSNGIISHYFQDKNGLLDATMRHLLRLLGTAVRTRLAALASDDPGLRLRAMVAGNFDASQTSAAAMKTWLAFWASSMHSPAFTGCSASAAAGSIPTCAPNFVAVCRVKTRAVRQEAWRD